MAWTPTQSATDTRAILGNLLTFFEANQVEALAWASPTRSLLPFKKFYRTAEVYMVADFPHFGITKRRIATDNADDGLRIEYSLTWEIEVSTVFKLPVRTAAINQLQVDIDNYAYAVESMFMNIPNATLFANITGARHGYRSLTTSDPLERAIGDDKALFNLQQTAILQFTENP